VMVACGAEMVVAGPRGRRRVAATDFFRDTFVTAMAENEILTELRIPVGKHRAGAYCKLERQAGDFGVVGVAVRLSLSADGRCKECGIALTSVGPAVIRAARSEKLVIGSRVDAGTVAEAAKLAAEDSRPANDLRGSEEYKKEMVKVMTRRALLLALKRARSKSR
jgi:carbon-monoxide dehydrogenase medium subunit